MRERIKPLMRNGMDMEWVYAVGLANRWDITDDEILESWDIALYNKIEPSINYCVCRCVMFRIQDEIEECFSEYFSDKMMSFLQIVEEETASYVCVDHLRYRDFVNLVNREKPICRISYCLYEWFEDQLLPSHYIYIRDWLHEEK